MAADLKRQRGELERTQRLEAWADMARQVAHDIKNPLTPIQLSAEHAQRVNIDRGRPLSPVLDECVTAILSQVQAAAPDFGGVLQLRVVADAAARADALAAAHRGSRRAVSRRTRRPHRDRRRRAARPAARSRIDRTLFARALTNVIENALHAMPGGGALHDRSRGAQTARAASSVVGSRSSIPASGMDDGGAARRSSSRISRPRRPAPGSGSRSRSGTSS